VEELHWWAFRAMMDGLPEETRLVQIMGIRTADTSKMSKEMRAQYVRLKQIHALGAAYDKRPKSLEERNAELLERARRARKRAGEAT
jgi:hypothetical protein